MKAQHLAAYFKKRIARPIQYDVCIEQEPGCVIFWAGLRRRCDQVDDR
jgi:hypothetical protein